MTVLQEAARALRVACTFLLAVGVVSTHSRAQAWTPPDTAVSQAVPQAS
jgi:hypothetical protein